VGRRGGAGADDAQTRASRGAPALVPRVAPPEPTAHPATRVGFLPACRYPPYRQGPERHIPDRAL